MNIDEKTTLPRENKKFISFERSFVFQLFISTVKSLHNAAIDNFWLVYEQF